MIFAHHDLDIILRQKVTSKLMKNYLIELELYRQSNTHRHRAQYYDYNYENITGDKE